MNFSDYQQPVATPLPSDAAVTTTATGPTQPFLSADSSGNVVLGASLVTNSFAAPTGSSTMNFSSSVIVGNGAFPPSTSAVALEIPTHQTLGLAQASSLLISDFSSNAVFYATSNQPPLYTGPVARVFGDLKVDGSILGPSGAYSQKSDKGDAGASIVGSQGPKR